MSNEVVVELTVNEIVVEREDDEVAIEAAGIRGPVGPQGPKGDSGTGVVPTIVMPAGEQIFAHRAVKAVAGVIFLADPTQSLDGTEIAGVALNAAAIGEDVTVQTNGPLSDPAFTFSAGLVWCGLGGILTQTEPTPGAGFAWLAGIGVATSATDIVINRNLLVEF